MVAAIGLFVLSGTLVEVLLGGGAFGPDDVARTSAMVAAFAVSIPLDALAYPLSRGLYATHDTVRQVVSSFAGFGVVVLVTQALIPSLAILAIPFGYAAGLLVKDSLLGDVPGDASPAHPRGRQRSTLTVGTTAMNRPSRSG